MVNVLSVDNMRKSDAYTIKTKTPSLELMKKAGEGAFDIMCKYLEDNKIKAEVFAVVCGTGNNAGDGYVMGRLLNSIGKSVKLFICEDRFSEDGRHYFDECVKDGIQYEFLSANDDGLYAFAEADVIIDCIFGTGFHGMPKPLYQKVIGKINEAAAVVVSIDINSGLNGDNGMGECFVKSDLTISIGDFKPGHFLNMAKDVMCEKINCNIGIDPVDEPYGLIEKADIKECFEKRKNFSNKGDYSYIALVGGSVEYSGAIRLAAMANHAMRAGAGVVSVAAPKSIGLLIDENILEATFYPLTESEGRIEFNEAEFAVLCKKYKVIAIGMGIGNGPQTLRAIDYLIRNYEGILLIDADGITSLAGMDKDVIKTSKAKLVVTPHVMEFARLKGCEREEVFDKPVQLSKELAEELNAVVLLKGPSTIITDGKKVLITNRGCAGMATAGSGDVLSGILSGILGHNRDNILMAVAAGAYINGRAGEIAAERMGEISMTASDTVRAIAEALE